MSRRKFCPALRYVVIFCLWIPLAFVTACSSAKPQSSAVLTDETNRIRTIAVIPFQNIIPEDPSVNYVKCPISGTYFLSSAAYSGAPEEIMGKALVKKLSMLSDIALIAPDQVKGTYMKVCADSFKATPVQVVSKVGVELGADCVIVGYIYRYRERRGYQYAVEQPASVAFGIYLVRVGNGELVWKGVYDKTQSSLMENILDVKTFIKGRGTWLTAEQLAEAGIDQVFKTFPDNIGNTK